jgi:cellulose synthase/poly-beta-1,6-N-acetylglucosamine synthase-like glycosyltransferase/peptidoglycan/xylan/chitin deacetylase (PgdA/CDA1 family)/spore germination protein YaaH
MSNSGQIFQTDTRKRWTRVKWTSRIVGVILIFLLVVTILAIRNATNPSLPNMNDRAKAYHAILDPTNKFTLRSAQNKKYKGFKDFLEKKQIEDSVKKVAASKNKASLVRAAFYTPWNKASLPDLVKNADKLNTVYPEWFFIDTVTHKLQTRIDSAGLAVMKKNNLSIQPIFNNFHTAKTIGNRGFFDGKLLHVILNDSAKRKNIINQIADTLEYYQLQGLNIDFEELNETTNEPLTKFQKELYSVLHTRNLLVSMDVQARNEDYDFEELGKYNDHIILMAYDEFSDATLPGPISSQKWIEAQLDWMDDKIDASKIILGVAGYARDWITEEEGKRVEDITYTTAIDNAKLSNSTILFDNNTYNLHYGYDEPVTDSTSLTKHSIWLTDAATTFNILRFSDDYKTAGTALWHLGGEDPRIWKFYDRDLSTAALQKNPFDFGSLSVIPIDPSSKPTPSGEGELLNILYTPVVGKIKIEVDSSDMLIAEQKYLQLPSGYVYEKFAEDKTPMGPGHKIILTFDDGPDPTYTPKILAILEKEKIPATFFVIGLNAENHIPLLQRIYKDGYEIGNHTFTHNNVAKMSPERAELEMKTTRSLIECVTGHSTILFRAPYNADSEPQTYDEIEPIARSKKDNYIAVGESIDPNDWDPNMNADSIVNRTIRLAEETDASIILLHDAGGVSRQSTVDALPRIIAYFKKRGCKFTTVADLMGKTKDDIMPPVKQDWKNKLNLFFAEATYWGGHMLFALFIVGIVLSVSRMLLMAILAWRQKRKEESAKPTAMLAAEKMPLVSIIVPAYNEEINAVRTIESLLNQDYPNMQVVFIDDGSKDSTFATVSNAFKDNPSVKVFSKPNGGKASALNTGIEKAASEFVVCIDADTQLKQDAVSQLMKKFNLGESLPNGNNDEGIVGAVAGNVKVGNEVNMITRWQSIEYITSQNFDRRAFDLLNCITVVPGAIGGFRKEAIIKAGGFTTDTLAEDCDLTMRMHRIGYQVRNCNDAISYTEAPETMKQFMKQRFRWSFGVMQCFWKHRDAAFNPRFKNFGMVAMPNILIFQMILPFLAPLADLLLVVSLIAAGFGIIPASFGHILFYYLIFTLVDVAGAALAFAFEKEDYKKLLWMIPQRLIYRQLMYYIVLKSFNNAIKGELQGWGVLKRTGNVKQVSQA